MFYDSIHELLMEISMLKQQVVLKQQARLSMKTWLPLLQTSTPDLIRYIYESAEKNPLIEIKTPHKHNTYMPNFSVASGGTSEVLEKIVTQSESLYDKLESQIVPPLFPTSQSQDIAHHIIEYITEEGYFDGDIEEIAEYFDVSATTVEKIRMRFCYLEPTGVGARDLIESLLFQLDELNVEDNVYELAKSMIHDFESMDKYVKHEYYPDAYQIIKRLKNPPAAAYLQESKVIIPELFIIQREGELEVSVNGKYYPDVTISKTQSADFNKQKLEDARNFIKLLDLRKNTLQKIGIYLAHKQHEYFFGGVLKPLIMQEVADHLGYNQSTISRAVSGKYLECDRGVIALKELFQSGISGKVTSHDIKNFIRELIRQETPTKPLSDQTITNHVNRMFSISITRRSIAKYRTQLGIASSSSRKITN